MSKPLRVSASRWARRLLWLTSAVVAGLTIGFVVGLTRPKPHPARTGL